MPKSPRRPRDPNQLAKLIIGIAAGEEADERPEKDEAAVALGRMAAGVADRLGK